MKRCLSLLLSLLLLCPALAHAEEPELALSSPSAILIECATGEVLYEKNAHETLYPASVTKVMTMLLIAEAVENGTIALSDTVTASARASSFGGSCVYLEEGEQMSVEEMLKCIAVVSANDCAVAMAEHLCGSEEVFVQRMNERCAELGMTETHFNSCTGLYDEAGRHFTTAWDVSLMSRELLKHTWIRGYTTLWMDSIRSGRFQLASTNRLVYTYPGCTGLKTGYTSGALYCLSASAERDGMELCAVVMHCESSNARNADATKLLNYGFANYALLPLSCELPETLPVEAGQTDAVPLRMAGDAFVLSSKEKGELTAELLLPEKLTAPLAEGQSVGTVRFFRADDCLAERTVVCTQSVERMSVFGFWKRICASLLGAA